MRTPDSSLPLTGSEAMLAPATRVRRRTYLLTTLLLSVCACLVYSGALRSPFVFDDAPAIVHNPQVRKLWPLSEAMTPKADLPTSNRPLVALSFSLNYAVGGLDVFGYHVVNIALHVANALLVYSLLLQLLAHPQLPAHIRRASLPLSAAMSLIWCVHPLLSESVVYVTQRTELMSALFYLAALVCAARSFRAPRRRVWQWLVAAAALLGIGSKETAATLSIAILSLDRLGYTPSVWLALRRSCVLYAGLGFQLAIAIAMCLAAPYENAGVGFSDGIGPLQWLATQAAVILMYVRRTLWPDTLSVSYYFPIAQQFLQYWPQLLATSALFAAALWLAARSQLLAYPALLFFIYLSPSSSIVPMYSEVVAERRMYVPTLAIVFYMVLLGHWALLRLPLPRRGRTLAAVLLTLAISAALAARTHARVQDYASVERLWSAAVAADPVDPQARLQLAAAWIAKDTARARALATPLVDWQLEYKGAIDWAGRAHITLGNIDEAEGRIDSALARYDAVDPHSRAFRVALLAGANTSMRAERHVEAERRLRRAIAHGYAGKEEHHNLGVVLVLLGKHEAAAEEFARAYELDPSQPDSLNALATSLFMQGRLAQAADVLQVVLRSWPADAAAHEKLDQVLAALEKNRPDVAK